MIAVRGAWLSSMPYPDRIHFTGMLLSRANVFNDVARDEVQGEGGMDWFWLSYLDRTDQQQSGPLQTREVRYVERRLPLPYRPGKDRPPVLPRPSPDT
jgi:hypothetical protein